MGVFGWVPFHVISHCRIQRSSSQARLHIRRLAKGLSIDLGGHRALWHSLTVRVSPKVRLRRCSGLLLWIAWLERVSSSRCSLLSGDLPKLGPLLRGILRHALVTVRRLSLGNLCCVLGSIAVGSRILGRVRSGLSGHRSGWRLEARRRPRPVELMLLL